MDTLTIKTITGDESATTITTEETCVFPHLANVVNEHEADTGLVIDMRAEVAVLTRNVVVEGDPDSERYMFGVQV